MVLITHSEAASALVDGCPSPVGVMFSGTGRGFFGAMTDYYIYIFFCLFLPRNATTTSYRHCNFPKMRQYVIN